MKKILFILASLLIGMAAVLVSSELFLRINQKFGYIYNSLRFKNDKMCLYNYNLGYVRPSTLLGYEIIPNCQDIHLRSPSNSYGLIGKEYKLEKNNNTFRILLLGDSIAWHDWARQFLEENLNNNSLLNLKFEIWNASCPGYDVRRYYLYLKHRGLRYKPDMVIILLCMNDFELNINVYYKNRRGVTEYYFPTSEISKKHIINPFLMKHSYFYRFAILKLDTYLLNQKKFQARDPQEEAERYYMQMIKEICEKNKIHLFVAIFPYLKPLDEYEDYQIVEYKTINKVMKDLQIHHLNLYEHLSRRDLYDLRDDKEDDVHPSREANRIIAKLIYDYMLSNYFNNN